ncbi:MAG: hypothetical protein COA49_09795 [Bacteroidetes bacterium]|nr:MAG: hypothetical protein COA49_09795 [Bacteroidota bacterium]
MRNLSILILAFLTINLSAQTINPNPNPSSDLDQFILSEMEYENIPGMSTVVVKDGEIVWIESYGFADIENNIATEDSTIFLLASMSKLFTGTALMQLYETGQIDLYEDINNYLPFPVNNPNYPSEIITFMMLMTHTSSISDGPAMDNYYSTGDPTIELADCMERYFSTNGIDYDPDNNFNNSFPGLEFEYSNMATALAGYLVEVISNEPFDDYCDVNLLGPMCMHNSAWHLADLDSANIARPYSYSGGANGAKGEFTPIPHYGFADYPNGLLRSNVQDLAKYAITFLQNGSFNGNEILSPSSVFDMLVPQIPFIDVTQGLNWYMEEIYLSDGNSVFLWGHNGGESGVSTDLYINPLNNIGVIVLSNGEGENLYVVDELYNYALTLSTSGVGNPSCNPLSLDQTLSISPQPLIFPNPTTDSFTISLGKTEGSTTCKLFDTLGNLILTELIPPGVNEFEIDTSNLTPGFYLFSTSNDNTPLHIEKITILR